MRFILALQCFFALLFTGRLPETARPALPPPEGVDEAERERIRQADALATAEARVSELEQERDAAKGGAEAAEKAASEREAELTKLKGEVERLEGELSEVRERELKLASSAEEAEAAKAELDKLRERLTKAEGKLEEAQTSGSLAILGWLQREGRLIDFLQESIDDYDDEQVGAAVRAIHKGCAKVLAEALTLEAILPGEEESRVTVPAGFYPVAIALTGNVKGDPPFKGTLMHHGWRTTTVHVPVPETDPKVLMPAEVEL